MNKSSQLSIKEKQLEIALKALKFYSTKEHIRATVELELENIEEITEDSYYIEGYYPIEAGAIARTAMKDIQKLNIPPSL